MCLSLHPRVSSLGVVGSSLLTRAMAGVQDCSTIVLHHPMVRMVTVVISTHVATLHSASTSLFVSINLSIHWFTWPDLKHIINITFMLEIWFTINLESKLETTSCLLRMILVKTLIFTKEDLEIKSSLPGNKGL